MKHIPFNLAKLAKAKGFKEKAPAYYTILNETFDKTDCNQGDETLTDGGLRYAGSEWGDEERIVDQYYNFNGISVPSGNYAIREFVSAPTYEDIIDWLELYKMYPFWEININLISPTFKPVLVVSVATWLTPVELPATQYMTRYAALDVAIETALNRIRL